MKSQVGVTATAAKALSEMKWIFNDPQGSSEVSIMFVGVKIKKKKPLKLPISSIFPK